MLKIIRRQKETIHITINNFIHDLKQIGLIIITLRFWIRTCLSSFLCNINYETN